MPDANHVIALGIGTPSDIPHFLTLGLSIADAAPVVDIASLHTSGFASRGPRVRGVTSSGGRIRNVEST